ncbi:MAG: ATP-binding protein, partial [Myxococcota bacterium]
MGVNEAALAVVDWFVPEKDRSAAAIYGGSSQVFRTRLVVLTTLVVGVCLLLLMCTRVLSDGADAASIWILGISGVAMLCLPFVTRWTGSRTPATAALIIMALIVLPMRAWSTGGLTSTVVAWYCGVPLFVWFAAGRRMGVLITLICILQIGFFGVAQTMGFEFVSVGLTPMLRMISMIILLLLILFLALVSDVERAAQVHDLRSLLDELGQSHEALERKSAEAEQAARAKAEFLASMSHELRTPLNGVMGMTQLLSGSSLESEQARWVGTLESSAQLLLTVINDVLDVSRLNDGMVELDVASMQSAAVVDEVLSLLAPVAEAKGLAMTRSHQGFVPEWVMGDKVRIQQILMNLVGNGIKFTADGSVHVRTTWVATEQVGGGVLRFEVEDTGIGIEPEAQAQIFDWFSQADASTSRKYGGSGLGLTISARLVALMGGRLGVDSGVGVGSTFWVELPSDVAAAQSCPAPLEEPLAGRDVTTVERAWGRVLVVEDNLVNQLVARRLLERLGCQVDVADGGERGLELWSEVNYDLVFMDCEMPGMDGYETTRQLRLREAPGQHTPIVALTAHALPEMVAKCLECGMDG